MTSGVWNDRPKTSGIMIAKPSHSLRRRSGSQAEPFVEPQQGLDRLGNDEELAHEHADEEQAQAERQVDVDEPLLVRIQPGRDERPDLDRRPTGSR